MKRILLLAAGMTALVSGSLATTAQQVSNDANPLYHPVTIRMGTLSVPPIEGAPFTATALIENRRTLPDGTVSDSRNMNLIGRDSSGRTRGEMRSGLPVTEPGTPQLKEVHLYDPQLQIKTVYYPETHIATKQAQAPPRQAAMTTTAANNRVKVEDLGTETLQGLVAQGTRRTVTIPAGASGSTAPITVVDEYWYSEDLHVNVLLTHNDPRTGLQTVALTNIVRAEPDAAFLEVPEGYKIVDMTPPAVVHQANVTKR